MSRKQPRRAAPHPPAGRPGRSRRILLGGLALLGLGGLALWLYVGPGGGGRPGAGGAAGLALGAADTCRSFPRFTASLGVGPRANIGTAVQGVTGLAIMDPDKPADQGGLFQHESWDDAGHLGPYVLDDQGNVFVAPVPLTSLQENPPEQQNRVYRVDTDSMAMTLFAELPAAGPPSGANPFGVIGLALDCDTDSLYVSSVAGSTAGQELGRIYRVELATGRVADQLEGLDPFGLATFNGSGGKRLYYGLARKPELWSVALDRAGDFAGEPRRELSLAELPQGTSDKIRRLRFGEGPTMTLHAYDFNYSLQVASERREELFTFAYDPATDAWTLQGQPPSP